MIFRKIFSTLYLIRINQVIKIKYYFGQDVRQEGDDNEIITNIQTQICGYNTIITANQDTCRMTMDAAPKVTNIRTKIML